MRVCSLDTQGFRNLHAAPLELPDGITVVHGPNGAGKTNLLEAIYFGLTGHACRGNSDRDLIAHDEPSARVELELGSGEPGARRRVLLSSIDRGGERRRLLDGAAASGAGLERPAVSVFLPDRLALVKGPPAHRRLHLDRFVAALWPARADLRLRFGRALAQRNALVSRIRAGFASQDALPAWDEKLIAEAEPLRAARAEACERLQRPFTEIAERLGLPPATLRYRSRVSGDGAAFREQLATRRAAGLDRAYLSFGPQLDEIPLSLAGRSLRRFASQGQQRVALLALLFAERDVLIEATREAPIMLLDDVFSELDPTRRGLLIQQLGGGSQSLITATEAESVPAGVSLPDVSTLAVRDGRLTGLATEAPGDDVPSAEAA